MVAAATEAVVMAEAAAVAATVDAVAAATEAAAMAAAATEAAREDMAVVSIQVDDPFLFEARINFLNGNLIYLFIFQFNPSSLRFKLRL